MKLRHLLPIILLVPALCSARTWLVEQDGSGDYTDIQPAVDAASPRDTVLVGPGRYDTFWIFDSNLRWEVIVGVGVDSLTIIGTDRDNVIIGPTAPYPLTRPISDKQVYASFGIAYRISNTWTVVENMTFVNTDVGIDVHSGGIVRNCIFRTMWFDGVTVELAKNILVENCIADECDGSGICVQSNGLDYVTTKIINCSVYNSQVGIRTYVDSTIIEQCTTVSCHTGIAIDGGNARVSAVIAENCYVGVNASSMGYAELENIVVRHSRLADIAVYDSTIHGRNVVLNGPVGDVIYGGHTIRIANGFLSLHNSHIMPSISHSINILYHNGPDDAINLTGNYWGTAIQDTIATWIWDSHDDPSVLTTVRYEPFSPAPVPSENRSMGDVKAMFRR